MYIALYHLSIMNPFTKNVVQPTGVIAAISDTPSATTTNQSRYAGMEFDLPTDGVPTKPWFSDYEKAVIGHYERWGWVERDDQYIISNYVNSRTEDRNRPSQSSPEREPDYSDYYGDGEYQEHDWLADFYEEASRALAG